MEKLDERVVTELEEQLDVVVDSVCEKYGKQHINPELYLGLQQFAVQVAISQDVSLESFLIIAKNLYIETIKSSMN